MKKLLFLLPAVFMVAFQSSPSGLTDKERAFAASELNQSLDKLAKSIEGLSEAQLNYKAAPDRWSVKECVFHLALSENNLWQWIQGTVKAPANPDKRSGIKMSDEQVLAGISDRSHKVKTSEPFEPKNATWATAAEALEALRAARNEHINYVKNTEDDLRNHVAENTPVGAMDAYQLILFMSAHTVRHTAQIEEVKNDSGFPKN